MHERFEIKLPHLVEVSAATQILLKLLGCDTWFVACRHEHQLIVRLARGEDERYAIAFQCNPDVEKSIYHGSRAWALALIPLRPGLEVTPVQVAEIRSALLAPELAHP